MLSIGTGAAQWSNHFTVLTVRVALNPNRGDLTHTTLTVELSNGRGQCKT